MVHQPESSLVTGRKELQFHGLEEALPSLRNELPQLVPKIAIPEQHDLFDELKGACPSVVFV